jgi:hypothetical protein
MSRLATLFLLALLSSCSTPPPVVDMPQVAPTLEHHVEQTVAHEAQTVRLVHPLDVAGEAEQAVALYLQITDDVGSRGGTDAEAMAHVVTSQWWPREQVGFAEYENRGIRTIGRTRFDHFTVQSARLTAEGIVEVAAFLCVDSTSVWVIDRDSPDPPADLMAWLEGTTTVEPDDDTLIIWNEFADASGARPGFREPIIVWLIGIDERSLKVDSTENWRGAHPCEVEP